MFRAVTGERALLRAHRQFNLTDRFSLGHRRRWPGLLPVIYFVLSAVIFAETANAAEVRDENGSFSALHDYVQLISANGKSASRPNPNSGNVEPNESSNGAHAALRAFTDQIGVEKPTPTADLPKLVEADNLLDLWRERNSPTPPSAAPKGPKDDNGPVAGGTKSIAPVDATYVGAKVCATCHANQTEAFSHTLMGRIGKTQKGKFDCENCHGPGSAHVKAGGGRGVGGIISFRPEDQSRTAAENNAICLNCHQRGDRTYWPGSTHDTRGLMCSNCHTVMKNVSRKFQLRTAFEADTCFQCHKDRRAQLFRASHMPLREGKITCSNCHNPHGSFTEASLRENSINDNCYKCHAEKRGPFLFEHAPVRENCLNCHEAHGSTNEYSLKMPRPRLCTECHAFGHGVTGGPLQVQSISRSCQNCHTQVHGTNSPSGALLHR
jgi:DmsE family decaheme c-type cytochrome